MEPLANSPRLTEESLATQLGISKSPVREALNRLEAEGLVVIEPRRGAYVRQFSAKEIRDLYELREILEVHSIEAANVTPRLLSDLSASINRTKKFLKEGNKLEHIEEDMPFSRHDYRLNRQRRTLPCPRKHSAKDFALPIQILRTLRDHRTRRPHEDLPGSKKGLQTRGAARHARHIVFVRERLLASSNPQAEHIVIPSSNPRAFPAVSDNTSVPPSTPSPSEEYQKRQQAREAQVAHLEKVHRRFGNLRLLVVIVTLIAAWLSFYNDAFSPWWLLLAARCRSLSHHRHPSRKSSPPARMCGTRSRLLSQRTSPHRRSLV